MNLPSAIDRLERMRRLEKEQALAYRSLAARAEATGVTDLAERFHDLHADEQHHLSRLTARVLELGGHPADLTGVATAEIPLDNWEISVRERELGEIARYRALIDSGVDSETHELVAAILAVEERHASELGGKWTVA